MSKKRKQPFSDQLRRAIGESALTRYEICKRASVDQSVMHRFVHGMAGISMPTIDAICKTLGLRLVAEDKPRKKGGR